MKKIVTTSSDNPCGKLVHDLLLYFLTIFFLLFFSERLTPLVFSTQTKLLSVNLTNNLITDIQKGAFSNMTRMVRLILTRNKLSKIEDHVLSGKPTFLFDYFLKLSVFKIMSTKLRGSDDSDWSTKVMWRLCRWLIGRNLFWNSIVNKPHINLVALTSTFNEKCTSMASKAVTNLAHSSMSTEFSILRKLFSSMVGERRRKMMILYLGRKLDISIHDGRGGLPQTAHRNSASKIFRDTNYNTVVVAWNCGKFELDMQNF